MSAPDVRDSCDDLACGGPCHDCDSYPCAGEAHDSICCVAHPSGPDSDDNTAAADPGGEP